MTENNLPIALPADLPENLKWNQLIAPNGADIGEPEQYGYNYLLKQVNAAQRACNTLGGQAQDLSEEMLRYLAERYTKTEIDALLANKAKTLLGVFTADGTNDFVKWIDNFDKSGGIRVNKGTKTALNLPSIGEYWEGWLHYVNSINKVITLYEIRGYAAYYAALTDGIFYGWKQLATAEPPQTYDLVLVAGFMQYQPCKYTKTQENIVVISASVRPSSGYFSIGENTVSVLPVGYRPNYPIELPVLFTGTEPRLTGLVQLLPNGEIKLICDKSGQSFVHFGATFVAAS